MVTYLCSLRTLTMNEDKEKQNRHKKRMQRKKEHIDKKITEANIERGIVVTLTGNGKGKSSSAFGMAIRALGHQQKVVILQFLKGDWSCGEQLFLRDHSDVEFHVMETGFTWVTQNREQDIAFADKVWQQAKRVLTDDSVDMVIMDELTYMLNYKYLSTEEVTDAISQRPNHQNVIITGRAASAELIEIADTVSEIKDVKHAFKNGIKAQKGVEF